MSTSPWPIMPLNMLAEVRLGRQRSPKNHSGLQMRPYLRAANVGWEGLILDDVKAMNFTDAEMSVYALRPGDVLLGEASGSPSEVGKPALWTGELRECGFQNTLLRVRSEVMEPKFLLYYFRHIALSGGFVSESRGVGIHHLGRERLASWPTPQPSLPEQRRIVAILEEHLTALEDALHLAMRSRSATIALGAAIIAHEMSGLEVHEVTLGDLAASIKNGVFVSRAPVAPEGVPILRIGAVRPMKLDLSDLRYSRQEKETLSRADALLEPGDLVFTRYNGNPRFVGACAVTPPGVEPLTWPDKLIRVRLHVESGDPLFVAYACNFGPGRRAIEERLKTSAGQVGISGRELKSVRLAVPDIAVQKSVAQRLSSRIEEIDRLGVALGGVMSGAGQLRRVILAAAFSGRLTGRSSDSEVIEEVAEEESA